MTVVIEKNTQGNVEIGWFLFEADEFLPNRWGLLGMLALFIGALVMYALYPPGYNFYGYYQSFQLFPPGLTLPANPFVWSIIAAIYCFGRAFSWWGRLYKRSPANPYERFQSAILGRYVDMTIKQILLETEIDESEMQVLQFADASWIEERRKPLEAKR